MRDRLLLGMTMTLALACSDASTDGASGGSSSSASGGQGGAQGGTGGVASSGGASAGGSSVGGSSAGGSSAGGSGGGVPEDPCTGVADGDYCGGALGGNASHSSLYSCAGGVTEEVSPCSQGCDDGACVSPPADPCSSASSGNGYYCGENLNNGTAGALYLCQNGSTTSTETCANGCQINPPGQPDACSASGDPCANANGGNGPYCGGSLGAGDPNTLYECTNGATTSTTPCANGCVMNPPGTPDACSTSGGGSCCLAPPPGFVTQSYSACGGGGNHYGIDTGVPIGTPIYAGMAGTVVASALGYPNCYNNGCDMACWNAFNYVKLKADCGDPNNGANDFYIWYLHIDGLAPGISNGSHVSQGELVAYSGNSGCSSGPHIHTETASVPAGQNAYINQCTSVDPATRYCP